jgi:hypothetical protein
VSPHQNGVGEIPTASVWSLLHLMSAAPDAQAAEKTDSRSETTEGERKHEHRAKASGPRTIPKRNDRIRKHCSRRATSDKQKRYDSPRQLWCVIHIALQHGLPEQPDNDDDQRDKQITHSDSPL